MKRLASTILTDLRLQWRQGFYYAAIFVAAVWIVVLRQFPEVTTKYLLPVFILDFVVINTYWFIAGLVLLEKNEGTLEAQLITPLRNHEYLASKVITLAIISLLEYFAIILLTLGFDFNPLPLILGIVVISAMYTLVGFITIARYDSLNEFILPGAFFTVIFTIPMIWYFGIWDHPILYLHPLQGGMLLLKAIWEPIETWQWIYSLVYTPIWIYLIYTWARGRFYRFVISRAGARA